MVAGAAGAAVGAARFEMKRGDDDDDDDDIDWHADKDTIDELRRDMEELQEGADARAHQTWVQCIVLAVQSRTRSFGEDGDDDDDIGNNDNMDEEAQKHTEDGDDVSEKLLNVDKKLDMVMRMVMHQVHDNHKTLVTCRRATTS